MDKSRGTTQTIMYELPYITKYIQKVKCCSYFPLSPTFDKELDCSCCAKDVDSQKKKDIGYIVPEYHLAIGKDGMEDNTDPDHTDTRF
jgi:hypothetical protein